MKMAGLADISLIPEKNNDGWVMNGQMVYLAVLYQPKRKTTGW